MNKNKLNEICINITDGTHSSIKNNGDSDYFLLSCKNIKSGTIIIGKNDRKIDYKTLLSLRKRTKLSYNDILITSVGTIGEAAIINDNAPNYEFQRSVAILKPNNNIILSKYLYYYVISSKGQKNIKSNVKGAAQPCLFLNDIKNIEVFYPNINVQQHIVNTISFLLLIFLLLYLLVPYPPLLI